MRWIFGLFLLPTVALAAPVPKLQGENKLYVTVSGKVVTLDPDGTERKSLFDDKYSGSDWYVSPDGKRVLTITFDQKKNVRALAVREPGKESKPLATLGYHSYPIVWSADGKKLYGSTRDELLPKPGSDPQRKTWTIDVSSGEQTDLKVPGEYWFHGLTGGGELLFRPYFSIEKWVTKKEFTKCDIVRTVADKFDPKPVIESDMQLRALAEFRDGKRWVVGSLAEKRLGVFTVGTKELDWWKPEFDLSRGVIRVVVSPNGKGVAYVMSDYSGVNWDAGHGKIIDQVWVCDADGKNAKKVYEVEKDYRSTDKEGIWHLEWR